MFSSSHRKSATAGKAPGGRFARFAPYAVIGSAGAIVLALLTNCGGGNGTMTTMVPPATTAAQCSVAISSATGKWVTVANNTYSPPGAAGKYFFSFNQPSVNSFGEVVFRGRAKATGATGGEPHRGVWMVNLCGTPALQTIIDTTMAVPDPNNQVNPQTGEPSPAVFNETPSIPRIDISSPLLATRGNSPPVWTYIDPATGLETKAGTTGIFTWINGTAATGVNTLGNVPGFSKFQVPGAPAGTKFDVFPGSPSLADGKYIVFKGNYTLPAPTASDPLATVSKTGVYFRDISAASNPVIMLADSNTKIPGHSIKFGSTAPPSAANGKVVFTGLDNEENPTLGGIYISPLVYQPPGYEPPLTAIVKIGDPVPDRTGTPLADGSTFARFGEGLSYDGRYIAFWGAWGTDMRDIVLTCPTEGNKARTAYCLSVYAPDGKTVVGVPVNQGIFVHDTVSGSTKMVARAGTGQEFADFLYWVYSGRPPGTGNSPDDSDGEPPRWRSSAFAAVDGERGIIFKGSRSPIAGVSVPGSGIYAVGYRDNALTDPVPVLEEGNLIEKLDPKAPYDSTVASVGIEREASRNGWMVLTLSAITPAGETWAGIYATHIQSLKDVPPAF